MKNYNVESINILPVNIDGKINADIDNIFINKSPLVYILRNKEKIYIGETINVENRFNNHNTNSVKKELYNRDIIYSHYFNKSVILHLEAFLISNFSADSKYKLVNGNLGTNSHQYYNKEQYEEVFPLLWKKLLELNIASKSYLEITNSDIFKYSPYKSLIIDQQRAIITSLEALLANKKGVLIEGSAGTGKTIIAIYLIKLLTTPLHLFEDYELEGDFSINVFHLLEQIHDKFRLNEDNIALVISMSSLRKTLQEVFKNIPGLKKSMIISPTDISKKKYELVLVDESHRLKIRRNISNSGSFNDSILRVWPELQNLKKDDLNKTIRTNLNDYSEYEIIRKQSNFQIFFYDKAQSIKPSDIDTNRLEVLKSDNEHYRHIQLKSQIRSKGGDYFTDYVDKLLNLQLRGDDKFVSEKFEFKLFKNFAQLREYIFEKERSYGLSRIVSGYSFEWNYDKKLNQRTAEYDISLDGVNMIWNSTAEAWINSANAINEVGCIHTTQGYDIKYVGVIFGYEIDYDPLQDKIIINKEEYKDRYGKNNASDDDLHFYIINIYKTLLLRGIEGVYIYCCNKNLEKYLSKFMIS